LIEFPFSLSFSLCHSVSRRRYRTQISAGIVDHPCASNAGVQEPVILSQQSIPGVQRLPNKNIGEGFNRQFSIAQTFGQNRSSVDEEEGGNQEEADGNYNPGPMGPDLECFIPRKLIAQMTLEFETARISLSSPQAERACKTYE
jgi:hypothetical protein